MSAFIPDEKCSVLQAIIWDWWRHLQLMEPYWIAFDLSKDLNNPRLS